jgi:DNA-binding response OmpR family regulator
MSTPTVLIVEDDKATRLLITLNLQRRGYETLEAGTIDEGLDLLRRYGPQFLILDIMLPGGSGWDMLKAIDGDDGLANIPTLIVTAMLLGQSDGYPYPNIVGRLIKPFKVEELLRLIDHGGDKTL